MNSLCLSLVNGLVSEGFPEEGGDGKPCPQQGLFGGHECAQDSFSKARSWDPSAAPQSSVGHPEVARGAHSCRGTCTCGPSWPCSWHIRQEGASEPQRGGQGQGRPGQRRPRKHGDPDTELGPRSRELPLVARCVRFMDVQKK